MCFKIDWASLIVGRKFTVSALFYFVFEGNFPSTSPRDNIWRGDLTEGFCVTGLWAYIWRGLFRNFTVSFGCQLAFAFTRFILITDPDLHLPRSGFTSRSFVQVVKHYSELLVLTDKVLVPLS